jgi:hypothetical protein
VKVFSSASRPNPLVCPVCEAGELHPFVVDCAHFVRCGYFLGTAMLFTLEQVIALPEALGPHTCECGHPEMRRLPDGAFHCPSCGSEVLPVEAVSGPS